jgi:hypothetical protein
MLRKSKTCADVPPHSVPTAVAKPFARATNVRLVLMVAKGRSQLIRHSNVRVSIDVDMYSDDTRV